MEHEHVAGVLGRLIWGTDTSAFYRDIARLSGLPAGTRVLDIPCGGGVAFRALRPDQELHYVAADLSPVMLRRAQAEADRRGTHWIEFVETDVEALRFDDRSFDLVVTYTHIAVTIPTPSEPRPDLAATQRMAGEAVTETASEPFMSRESSRPDEQADDAAAVQTTSLTCGSSRP